MILYNGLFIVITALLIVAGVCLGLLIALAISILGKRGSPPSPTNDTQTPINQSKRIANSTVAMGAGLTAIVFSANLIPIKENPVLGTIVLVIGLAAIAWAWIQFRRI